MLEQHQKGSAVIGESSSLMSSSLMMSCNMSHEDHQEVLHFFVVVKMLSMLEASATHAAQNLGYDSLRDLRIALL